MAAIATLDLTTVKPDGRPRTVQMQSDASEHIRLVQLPVDARCKLVIGPAKDSDGALLSARISYGLGAASTYTNNASGTSLADGAIRGDLAPGDSVELLLPKARVDRPVELALWSDSTSAFCDVVLHASE